jgi:hypothetical protein
VPDYRHIIVAGQLDLSVAEASSLLLFPPVSTVLPGTGLVMVTAVCPFTEFDVDLIIYPSKGTLCYTSSIVPRPAPNDRIEGSYENRLRASSVLSNDTFYLVYMTFDSRLAWFDERLEAWLFFIGSSMVLTYPILPDVKAEKVKSHLPFVLFQCVCNTGFAGLESQAHLGQPDLSAFFEFD